ncbi:MAG TPA: protein DpdF [Polyangiaceae bacterium]|nr:protein DpdF [Polyangiaceae bacterium]
MIAPLRTLQELILGNTGDSHAPQTDSFLSRVEDALRSLRESKSAVGPADLAALLRQGMLRCHLARGEHPELRVPRGIAWPDESMWRLFNCDARTAGSEHFLVRAGPWKPAWLDADAADVVNEAVREALRRRSRAILADPRVTEYTGHLHYFSPGQREAVRAAFLMPAGSTIVVSLPTGAGKTLAFQLPALVAAAEGGLTVVVVPTVALARDQEERFRRLLGEHEQGKLWSGLALAYHGGLDDEAKNAIRAGIRHGALPIVFVSAEAAVGALRGPLFDAARQGRLRTFAIDEAHIVSQWGQQFRPEFQSIAGLRDALLASCPLGAGFRTLLLSATLTEESFETLRELFGQGGFQLVSELALRPEPAFLLHSAANESHRADCILEALRNLPRPLILYTTLREHAADWYERLRQAGFRRVRLVRGGDLADTGGEAILRDWRACALDVVVATSAFGLGVDQAEVRSVVHACLPENIDRYYQEVGRAGRDGNAAVALLVSTPQDLHTAEGLAEEKLISVDRAFERWEAMWVRRRPGTEGSYLLSLDDRPPDIPDTGVRNASWNLRTLVLMARAGLIAFAAHAPPAIERRAGEDEEIFESRRHQELVRFAREVAVCVRDSRHSDKVHWNDVVARRRTELRAADEEASRLVRELRDLQRPLAEIFSDVYTLADPPVRPPRLQGSCPVTRRTRSVHFSSADPEVTAIVETAAVVSVSLERALAPCSDDAARSWISYDMEVGDARESRRWHDRVLNLLRHAVSGGIVELCLSRGFIRDEDWSQLAARSPLRFLLRTDVGASSTSEPFGQEVRGPRLTLLTKQDATTGEVERIMRTLRPRHVIVLPRDLRDPERPSRRLFDVTRHLTVEDLLLRLEA